MTCTISELAARGRDVELAMDLAQYHGPSVTSHRNRRSAPSEEYGDGWVQCFNLVSRAHFYCPFKTSSLVSSRCQSESDLSEDDWIRIYITRRYGDDDHHDDDYDEVTPFFNVPKLYGVNEYKVWHSSPRGSISLIGVVRGFICMKYVLFS